MKIIKSPPAPESPLGYLYWTQERLNALTRSIIYKKALNNELRILKDKGANREQIDFSRYYYLHSEKKDWLALTKVFSIILEEVKGKPIEEKFGFIVNMTANPFTENTNHNHRNTSEEAIRSHVRGLIKSLTMIEEEKDAMLENFFKE